MNLFFFNMLKHQLNTNYFFISQTLKKKKLKGDKLNKNKNKKLQYSH